MIVVSDTSPINYLVQIDAIHVLAALFEQVVVPESVRAELLAARSKESVRRWVLEESGQLHVGSPSEPYLGAVSMHLDAGEREAVERKAHLLIIDERAGRIESKRLGLKFTGTLGILILAAHRGLIDLPTALERLKETNCYLSAGLITRVLRGSQ